MLRELNVYMCLSVLVTRCFKVQISEYLEFDAKIFSCLLVCLLVGPRQPGLNLRTKLVMLRIGKNGI